MTEDDPGGVSTWLAELARAPVPDDLVGFRPGDVVGGERYRIRGELGRGGMGIVYEAEDTKLNRQVALKTHQIGSPAARAQLLIEAQAMAMLSHPNVVAVHDVGEFDDGVFLVAELVTGGNLKTCRVPDHSWQDVVRAYIEAGRGLAYAHQSGLVHRDFKPGNVLRNQNGRCQVADFGIAISSGRSVRGEDAESTRPDVEDDAEYRLAGTPAYMAPELLLGAAADERSDQFSFSVALYEALVGGRPFKTTSLELLDDNRHEPPRGSVPPRVVRVLERGFATSPSERFESMTALLDDLERAVKPRRTGRFVLGSSVVVGAATWAALALPDDACDVALAPLATWSAEGQAALEAVFARDREAARQWPAMARTVDSFVTDWVETSTKLCEDRSLGPFAFESQQCLAELRSDADATLASLQLASDAATRTALHRAEAWTNPAMCLRPSFVEASKSASMFRRPRHRVVQLRLRDIVNAIDSGGEIDPLA